MAKIMVESAYIPRCNKCGNALDFFDLQNDFAINSLVSYGSSHDGEHVYLRLCCNCFDDLVTLCEVTPVLNEIEVPNDDLTKGDDVVA